MPKPNTCTREEYTMHCAECYATDGLTMIAHRVQGKMIGWLFVCKDCWPTMSEAIALERLEPETEEEDSPHPSIWPRSAWQRPYRMSWPALRAAAARIALS